MQREIVYNSENVKKMFKALEENTNNFRIQIKEKRDIHVSTTDVSFCRGEWGLHDADSKRFMLFAKINRSNIPKEDGSPDKGFMNIFVYCRDDIDLKEAILANLKEDKN